MYINCAIFIGERSIKKKARYFPSTVPDIDDLSRNLPQCLDEAIALRVYVYTLVRNVFQELAAIYTYLFL